METIDIEIWADNNQMKNELYEQLRLFINTLIYYLQQEFPEHDISCNDVSYSGNRSNTYNLDYDVVLTGSHISLDLEYQIDQIVLDTKVEDTKNLIWEVHNHVKGKSY